MPGKSKRSKSAAQREQNKKDCKDNDTLTATDYISKSELLQSVQSITNYRVVRGTFHQGNVRFQYPGIQCTYISFWALIHMRIKSPLSWQGHDVDFCITEGNDAFLKHCCNLKMEPKMLLVKELPRYIKTDDAYFECIQSDDDIITGTLDHSKSINTTGFPSENIAEAILRSFDLAPSCLLVCGGQTIAIAKEENNFFLFDPHSRGNDGFLHPTGSAVLVSFSDIQVLIHFIRKLLIDSLSQKPSALFELVPIVVSKQKYTEQIGKQYFGNANLNTNLENPMLDTVTSVTQTILKDAIDSKEQNVSVGSDKAIQSYFADQEKRDIEHRTKRQSVLIGETKNKNDYMRQYMRRKRENDLFREKENMAKKTRMKKTRETEFGQLKNRQKAAVGMKRIRDTETGKQENKRRAVEGMRKILNTDKGRDKHNRMSAAGMKKKINTEEGRKKHNARNAEGMRKVLRTEEGKKKHNERSAEGMKRILNTEDGRKKHNIRSAEGMKRILNTEDGRKKHNIRSAEGMKRILNTDDGRKKHNKRCAESMRNILNTDKGREVHKQRCAKKMKICRATSEGSKKNKESAAMGMRQLREDADYLRLSNARDSERKRKRRQQKEYVEQEYIHRKKRKYGISLCDSVHKFKEAVSEGSSYVCTCCHQVWFKQSVKDVSSVGQMSSMSDTLLKKCTTGYISVDNCEWICNTCIYNLTQGKIPKLSVINGMTLPEKPSELNLNNLEERLVSLRIPFMQIRSLARGGQFSLKGSVVNVPADVEPTIRALPRLPNESETIPVKLKRMKEQKHSVVTENVRPHAVMNALQTLLHTSELYKQADITIDDKWNIDSTENNDIGNDCSKDEDSNIDDSDTFSEVDDFDNAPLMTLLDKQSSDQNEILSVAPGEGQKPLSIFKDPNAEYLAFPTLFCGQKRTENTERHVPVYYSDICKWELRSVDRRVALHIPNIFYKMKKLQTEQICSKVHMAVRRCKTKGKSYTAGYILKDNMGESLVRLDEGYRIFRTIRNSPQYWENQKRDVFAMIRQLGLPTLFLSLSANDLYWPELIVTLGKLVDNKDYTEDLRNGTLSWQTRSRLVQSDPVTCVRHFDHRVSKFIETVLKSTTSPLGVLKDYFYRVEFQQRGSPHIHMLAWIENAPKYAENKEEDILEYIDEVASCSSNIMVELEEFLEYQKHKHSRTCRKGGKPVCRFGIPFPPMQETAIIRPFDGENRSVYEAYYNTIQGQLTKLETDVTFEEFLEIVGLSKEDYMMAVQTSVKSEKVFLKRKPIECRINPYLKNLLGVWKANHDVQFILDAYACAMYIVSYINKSTKGMSKLMAEACKEARKGNKSLKESVRHIGNKFLNAVEVSAQEAAYLILQLSMSCKSRKVEFIPTAPKNERVFLLKSKKELEDLPEESTEIDADNIIKRYSKRHEALESYCLADFVSKVVSISHARNGSQIRDSDNNGYRSVDNEDEYDQNRNALHDAKNVPKHRYTVTKDNLRIVLRQKPKIIRYVHYSEKVDSNNYYREQLMLFHPWRNEDKDLLGGYETFENHFRALEKDILKKKTEYDANIEVHDEIEAAVQTEIQDCFDDVCPNIESIEANDAVNKPSLSHAYSFYNPESHRNAYYDIGADIGLTSHIPNDEIEMIQNRLTEKDYLNLLSKLNTKQRQIFTHIIHSLTHKPCEKLHIFITGGAGVGKSLVVRTLYQALHRLLCSESGQNPEDIRILMCAYTGLAAYNIQGSTLHSAFCIEPNKKLTYKRLSDDKRNTLQTKYKYLTVLIVDEVSMVGNEMLNFLYHRLQEIKCNQEPFGGVHVILVGDLFQLRPVGDGWIFSNATSNYASLAPNLWQSHFTMFELTEIMRQKDDVRFAELLNRIREEKQTKEDLDVLQSRSISVESQEYQRLKKELHLFPCNAEVDAHNRNVYNSVTTLKSEIKCADAVLGEDSQEMKDKIVKQLQGKKMSDTGNLCEVLRVAVDLCYDTTHNISVSDGICNGTPCVLKKIHYIEKNKKIPSCLWVEFPDKNIGRQTRKDNSYYYKKYPEVSKDWTPIWAVKRTFMFWRKAVVRKQFPLKASSGKTIHKAQGQTKSCIVVDMTSGPRPHQHYVAFSRVTRLQGLYLLNGLNGHIKVDRSVIQEMQRLRKEAHLKLSYKPVDSYRCDLVTVFQNAQSLHLHLPLVQNDSTFIAADIICLAETRLQQSDQDNEYTIQGFHSIIRNDQQMRMHGVRPSHGLAIYVKNCFQLVSVDKISTEMFESLSVNVIDCRSQSIYSVTVIYKAPRCGFEDFRKHILSLSKLALNDKLLIVGDFNFDISNDLNRNFIEVMRSAFPNARLLNTPSTTQKGTKLDACFSTCKANSDVISCVWSYHHTLVVSVSSNDV